METALKTYAKDSRQEDILQKANNANLKQKNQITGILSRIYETVLLRLGKACQGPLLVEGLMAGHMHYN